MALRLCSPLRYPHSLSFIPCKNTRTRRLSVRGSSLSENDSRNETATIHFPLFDCQEIELVKKDEKILIFRLVLEVKEKLEKYHNDLPVGSNGRDDEDVILWFLKDIRFSVEEAISKLTKAIVHAPAENERLGVFLIEEALSKLPEGKEEILGIIDLGGFGTKNADLQFLTFLAFKLQVDVFYYYFPKRLGQVLFVEALFVFRPIWQLVKPLLKHYASLVRFCSADIVRKEYFKEETAPPNFRDGEGVSQWLESLVLTINFRD